MKRHLLIIATILLFVYTAEAKTIPVTVQKYDAASGRFVTERLDIDPAGTAIIVIDMWNYHWCMTASERVSAMVPRMNAVLDIARCLGMQVVWNPSDAVTAYAGWPQYEEAVAVQHRHAPDRRSDLDVTFSVHGGSCLCGPGLTCGGNYGWDAMHPDLVIGDGDLFSSSTDEIYSLLTDRGVTDIIYMGVHTNVCVFGKPGAMSAMWKAGFRCFLARDLNDAFTHYDPETGFTPDEGTARINADLQRGGIPCINMGETFRKAGLPKAGEPVDYVRFTPWGKQERPYFFERKTIVTLTAPWLENADIRYTTDGTEPTAQSAKYTKPLELQRTQTLRSAAFRGKKRISRLSGAYYVKLSDTFPPQPDIYLDELEYIPNEYLKTVGDCLWFPVKSQSFEKKPLRIRGKNYQHGLGMRAPGGVQYDLRPEYTRFVALAGVDDNLVLQNNGLFLAMHSSVVFRVFIDGKLAAESPVMRISQEPWRFDVPIPQGSRRIGIACMDAGSRRILDYGNWVEAGFTIGKGDK
jgi:nicotinamidase-related amidase